MNITIKKEFQDMIFPLSPEEFILLEQSVLKYGIKDPLVIWRNGKDYLLDGHHRMQLIKKHNIKKFPTKVLKFSNKREAVNFIIEFQLGRRNCTQEAIAYLRGLRYRNEKLDHGGDRKSSGNNCHLKTEQKISELYNVSPRTIRNDEKFTYAIDLIIDIFPTKAFL